MAKLYYGSGNCSIEGSEIRGVEIRYRGAIEIEDKTSDSFVVLTGDYKIESLAIRVGCDAPLTMKWTPAGTIWLGADKQVYILPFDSLTPIPIGQKITSAGNIKEDGLESIPSSQTKNASAVYHDGFYKLSVASTGATTNDRQWWLDIARLSRDKNKYWGPWYGPMKGMTFHGQTVLSGPGDNSEWYAGESGNNG